jgi:hypothetical protein
MTKEQAIDTLIVNTCLHAASGTICAWCREGIILLLDKKHPALPLRKP